MKCCVNSDVLRSRWLRILSFVSRSFFCLIAVLWFFSWPGAGIVGAEARTPADSGSFLFLPAILSAAAHNDSGVENGWYVRKGKVVWGYGQHNGWWRAGQRANLTRNAPGQYGPNRTEILPALVENMIHWGYPGFEHNYGLWYDRRRDLHDRQCRNSPNVKSPFLEQPWSRSGIGQACDGLSRYDLTKYNSWYFNRLHQFAKLAEQNGVVFFNNFYMQHALLELTAHYVDFPWRPGNSLQLTGLPSNVPAANIFYDVSNQTRYQLHRDYIFHVLDVLGEYPEVVHLLSEEYTGPKSFVNFWIDTIREWEGKTGKRVHIGLGATKDVLDAILADPVRSKVIDTIDLRYWWYDRSGRLYAPPGGRQVAGRFAVGYDSAKTTPEQLYRQVKYYRMLYPDKAIIHTIDASRKQTWAFLMAGGSMIIRMMEYPGGEDPKNYIAPADSAIIMPTYNFIRTYLATKLLKMKPKNLVMDHSTYNWCLADGGKNYLVYALHGGRVRLNLSSSSARLHARWFNPAQGSIIDIGWVSGGQVQSFTAPTSQDWALLLTSS